MLLAKYKVLSHKKKKKKKKKRKKNVEEDVLKLIHPNLINLFSVLKQVVVNVRTECYM